MYKFSIRYTSDEADVLLGAHVSLDLTHWSDLTCNTEAPILKHSCK